MKNEQQPSSDLQQRLEGIDALPSEPVPAGWSRRNWVQREAIFAAMALANNTDPREEPA